MKLSVIVLALGLLAAPSAAVEQPERRQNRADLVVVKDRLRQSINIRSINVRANGCALVEGCVNAAGRRRILEFDTYVHNRSDVDLVLGRPQDRPDLYEYSPCHDHYHLRASFVYGLTRGGTDTAALFEPSTGRVFLRNENAPGPAEEGFVFPAAATGGAMPIAGDWDGDGTATPGLYEPEANRFTLLSGGNDGPTVFAFRPAAGATIAIAGDWDGDGKDTVGLYDPATGTAYLKRKNDAKKKHQPVALGAREGAWTAVAGDWDGDGVDTIGLYQPATGTFALVSANAPGASETTFAFGGGGPLVPLAGDWDQDGTDTVGVYDPAAGEFRVRDENSAGEPSLVFALESGATGAVVPLAGDWDYNFGELVLPGRKEAFCWLDSQRVSGGRTMQFFDCNQRQGLTAGWADIYIRGTDCQWIDITDLPPGVYQLAITVNAERLIPEGSFENNSAIVKVRIPEPRQRAKPPEVRVTSPEGGEHFEVGQPVTIRWTVKGGTATHQELWLADVHDDHPSKVLLVDGAIPPGARSYTWVPTEEFASPRAQFIVRAQDDENFVGTDARTERTFSVGEHSHE